MDAQAVGNAMFQRDEAAQLLGMSLGEVSVGRAVVSLTVGPNMVNGLGVCHGGIIFTLADAAMAFASNAANESSLATSASIDFMAPASVGDRLAATAEQNTKPGRSAVNDVTVVNQTGAVVAVFRGRTLTVGGPVLQEDT